MNKFTLIIFFLFSSQVIASQCDSFGLTAQNESETILKRLEVAEKYETCLFMENAKGLQEVYAFKSTPRATEVKNYKANLESQAEFMGQNFGIGFGISFHDKDLVDDAEVSNGVIVAKSQKKEEARVLLEFHTLIACNNGGRKGDFGCGPFAAIATKGDDILGGVGLGWLWSWRDVNSDNGSGFSIGIGAIVDNDIKDLADGFEVGAALPEGETAIRYTTESKVSYLLFISNTF